MSQASVGNYINIEPQTEQTAGSYKNTDAAIREMSANKSENDVGDL